MTHTNESPTTLVTGASGYVGGRLAAHLIGGGALIRVAGRHPDELRRRFPDAEAVEIDVTRRETLEPAMRGISTAYYLVHSMEEACAGFEERDRIGARNFAQAAFRSGVQRIVYLGGLGDDADDLSAHLESRHETGRVLAEYGPSLIELRAGIVIGKGSASYRMLEDLVERLPLMITPRWVDTRSQPIAIDDVVRYLEDAGRVATDHHHTIVEVGGPEVLSYRQMLRRVGGARGRTPVVLSVPLLTPFLSSLWCGVVTSVPTSVARPLIEGQRNETVVRSAAAAKTFPDVVPIGFDEAVARVAVEAA
ncbi:MAG: NAD(P)H-binding protein [Actinomycetota bacterium]